MKHFCLKKKALVGEVRPKEKPWKIISTKLFILLNNDVSTKAKQSEELKTAMFITEYSGKIYKPTLHNKAVSIPI